MDRGRFLNFFPSNQKNASLRYIYQSLECSAYIYSYIQDRKTETEKERKHFYTLILSKSQKCD